MSKGVELFPLRCVRCGTNLRGFHGQVLWTCPACEATAALDERDELNPVEVNFLPALPQSGILRWLPYWVMRGRIAISKRSVAKGAWAHGPSGLWNVPQLFWIAAFETTMMSIINDCMHFLHSPPVLERGDLVGFEPVTIDVSTGRALAEFAVVCIEANQPDVLADVQFEVQFDLPSLWVLPFQEEPERDKLIPRFDTARKRPFRFVDLLTDEARQWLRKLGIEWS